MYNEDLKFKIKISSGKFETCVKLSSGNEDSTLNLHFESLNHIPRG